MLEADKVIFSQKLTKMSYCIIYPIILIVSSGFIEAVVTLHLIQLKKQLISNNCMTVICNNCRIENNTKPGAAFDK